MKKLLIIFLTSGLVFNGCKKDDETETLRKAALENYTSIVLAAYEDSYAAAQILRNEIYTFVDNPTADGLANCKQAWLTARTPYGQTEAFRFYGGPIDDADGPEGLINAWPMDENFIDYVDGNAGAGLINNPATYPEITKEALAELNESISEESIFTGYHAIEFLLWGQDLSTSGPGTRPYTDYLTNGGTAANQARRGQYLKVVADLLLENLASVLDEWKAGGAYRKQFLETDTKVAMGYIFTSLGEMSKGELSGERMFVAIDTKDQENEHSCFSDNTTNDILLNFKGLQNVYFGKYQRTDGTTIQGTSIAELAQTADASKAAAAETAFTDAAAKLAVIPSPFDQAILNNTDVILAGVTSLRTLSDRLADVGLALEVEY